MTRKTSYYPKRITSCIVTHMMSMAIGVKTPRIDSECSLEKEFSELICINPEIVLYLKINWAYLCHICV